MLGRLLARVFLVLEILTGIAAAAIVLCGGFQGRVFGLPLSARDPYRTLLVFSVLLILRSWATGPFSAENQAIGWLLGGMTRRTAGRLSAALAGWAAAGATLGLSGGAGLFAGHRDLFPHPPSAIVTVACAALLYALAAACAGLVAFALAAIFSRFFAPGFSPPSPAGHGGVSSADPRPGPAGRAPVSLIAVRSLALLPLGATLVLAGRRAVWSFRDDHQLLVGVTTLAGLAAGSIFFFRVVPAVIRVGVRRPLAGAAGLAVVAAAGWWTVTFPGRLPSPPASPSAAGRDAPNVVLITLDTLRADRLGCYGNARVQTPSLDALAARGVRFSHAVCQIPETGPSHMSILSGRYPQVHGARANGQRPSPADTMATILSGRGYRTAAFVSGYVLKKRMAGLERGFDVYDETFSNFEGVPGLTLVSTIEKAGLVSYVDLWKIWAERRGDRTNREVFRWLRTKATGNQPFFLWVHYYDVHGPYDPPAPYSRMYYSGNERDPSNHSLDAMKNLHQHQVKPGVTDAAFYVAQYDAEVTWTDHLVGNLLDELRDRGVADRTIVIAMADHGESLTEHGLWFDHGPDVFEPSIAIPFVVAGPGVARGVAIEGQVQSVDVAPTVLDLLGIPLPPGEPLDGRSLKETLRVGGRSGPAEALPAFIESNITRERGGRRFEDPVAAKARAIRWNGLKLVLTPGFGDNLFDLSRDPAESRDSSTENPLVRQALRDRLAAWIASAPAAASSATVSEGERKLLESLGYLAP